MKDLGYDPIIEWGCDRVKKNKNAIIIVNGPTGSGKTYFALALALEFANKLGTKFTVDTNMDFNFIKLLEKTMNPELDMPGVPFLFEEVGAAGSGSSARQWQSQANIFFNSFAQTSRHRNQIFIMTSPYFSNLDTGVRKLCHLQLEMKGINYRNKISYAKPYFIQVNSRTGKIYFKYPRISFRGHKIKIKQIAMKKPDDEICRQYEILKTKYTTELNKGMTKGEKKERKPIAMEIPDWQCPFCSFKWKSRVKEPRRCPKCVRNLPNGSNCLANSSHNTSTVAHSI